ncbi:MAG: DMT family transporter [Planctomycetia bacterium]
MNSLGSGEAAALTAAALWACSSLFYSRARLSAWQMNFGKNVLASGLLVCHLLIWNWVSETAIFQADLRKFFYLSLSSLTGIVIGDTFYFRSLQILGPRRALMVATTAPLFATAIGWLLLKEPLTQESLVGIFITLSGVILVVSERSAAAESAGHFPAPVSIGILTGLGGALCNAIGATLSHMAMHQSVQQGSSGRDALEATVIRVTVAAVFSILALTLTRRLVTTARAAFDGKAVQVYLPAVICGPWLGIWMSQLAYRNSMLAIAITLTSTMPIFVLPLVRIAYGTPITLRGVAGAVIALAGIYLTVAGQSSSNAASAVSGSATTEFSERSLK